MSSPLAERIQKLLSLATSDVEHEAQAAMLKAQALMAEHDLTMHDLGGVVDDSPAVSEIAVDKREQTIQYWQKLLARVVARNFRCQVYYRRLSSGRRDIILVGTTEDAEIAHETVVFAFQSARACWDRYRRQRTFSSRKHTEAAKRDFMVGFAVGLRDAFSRQVKEKALTVVPHPAIQEHLSQKRFRSEPRVKINNAVDLHAQQHGYRDGTRLSETPTLPERDDGLNA